MQTQKVIEAIVNWLTSYCDNSGLRGFVVGVSGGIDSAVTSTLCAMTGHKVMALNMPIYQDAQQVALSSQHIQWLEFRFASAKGVYVDLTPTFQTLENTLPKEMQDPLTMANSRSRLRMVTLYAHASHYKMLVAGTGNKVEDFGVGFFTKYGDGGVDLSPIGDLLKTEVYLVAKALGIIEPILAAPPTDGLWGDNRTDELQIGATYEELEWAMNFQSNSSDQSGLNQRKKEVLDIYNQFHQANKHKMIPIPVFKIPPEII